MHVFFVSIVCFVFTNITRNHVRRCCALPVSGPACDTPIMTAAYAMATEFFSSNSAFGLGCVKRQKSERALLGMYPYTKFRNYGDWRIG